MEPFVIKQSQAKQFGLSVLAVLMTALCFGLLYFFLAVQRNMLMAGIIALCGVFFGFGTVVIVGRLIKPRDLVIVDAYGITDNSSASAVGFVDWRDIMVIRETNVLTNKFIGVYLNNVEKYLQTAKPLAQKAMRANMNMNYPPVCITLQSASCNFNTALATMVQYHQAYLAANPQYPPQNEVSR